MIGGAVLPSNLLTVQGVGSSLSSIPRCYVVRLTNNESIKINLFTLVLISIYILIPSLFLLIVYSKVRASPLTSLLKSIGYRLILYNPKEETSPRVYCFLTTPLC